MPPLEPHACDKTLAIDMIHSAVKSIFVKLEKMDSTLSNVSVQGNELGHVSGAVAEIKEDVGKAVTEIKESVKAISQQVSANSEKQTVIEGKVRALSKDVAALTATKAGIQRRFNGFWWEIARYGACCLIVLIITHFPKIAKYMGVASTISAPK